MNIRSFPGGWYVHALPSGAYAVLYPGSHLETHQGRIPVADEYPLFPVITTIGGFQIAGQGHLTGKTQHWRVETSWMAKRVACGVSPVIFDRFGALHISDCSQGSQGFRFVTPANRIVTGDETLVRDVAPGVLVHEFTEIADLLIGQGHEDSVVVWDGAVLRRVAAGQCYQIRVEQDGERVTVSFYAVAPDGLTAFIYDTTLAELRALPPISTAPAPPIDTPPEPTMPTIPNHINTVRAVLREMVHIDPSRDGERGAITEEVARRLNHDDPTAGEWGRKDRDRDPNNQNNSDDALTLRFPDRRFAIIDILRGLDPGQPREDYASWGTDGATFADGENGYFRAVSGAPAPPEDPDDPPPTLTLEQRVAALEAWIRRPL